MKKYILITAAFALCVPFMPACKDGSTSKVTTSDTAMKAHEAEMNDMKASGNTEHDNMMKTMMDDMSAVKMSGDFDVDFANMMIPHHQSAVDMAQSYLPKGEDEKIKTIAKNIIDSQKKEIEELKTMTANHTPSAKKDEHAGAGHAGGEQNKLVESMNKMMNEMKGMKMTGDADKDFVMMMIPHHQSAVDMAENEISHGKHAEMKKFAQKVIDSQSKEIKEFKEWLKK
ncbi:MAG: DUF305 domain-containing protein [Verrucomicrobiota bacterium]|nr:DUF305 domain-containing protein [Verrucomicrobiota bacterium]